VFPERRGEHRDYEAEMKELGKGKGKDIYS
jgi:hypothetical protein